MSRQRHDEYEEPQIDLGKAMKGKGHTPWGAADTAWREILRPLVEAVQIALWMQPRRAPSTIGQVVDQLITDGVLPGDVKLRFSPGRAASGSVSHDGRPGRMPSRIVLRLETVIEVVPTAAAREGTRRAPRP